MKAVLSFSGGADSTSLLMSLLNDEEIEEISLISLDYNQKHKKELSRASDIYTHLRVSHKYGSKLKQHKIARLDLSQFGNKSVLVSSSDVPDQSAGKQTSTVVPFRNTLFVLLIASFAKALGSSDVFLGPVKEDFASYPDCRRDFFDSLETTLRLSGDVQDLKIHTPFVDMSKIEVIKKGSDLEAPYQLTWTCYKGGDRPCLKCDSCVERVQSFYENNTMDPLLTPEEWFLAADIYESSSLYEDMHTDTK